MIYPAFNHNVNHNDLSGINHNDLPGVNHNNLSHVNYNDLCSVNHSDLSGGNHDLSSVNHNAQLLPGLIYRYSIPPEK